MFCIVLKRGEDQRYDLLHKAFGQTTPVVWDRRRGCDRRRTSAALPFTEERRLHERREPASPSWMALGFVVVQRQW